MVQPLPADSNLVRPYEVTKVYATGAGGFHKKGEELEVHPLLAKKLVTNGGATKAKAEIEVKAPDALKDADKAPGK